MYNLICHDYTVNISFNKKSSRLISEQDTEMGDT